MNQQRKNYHSLTKADSKKNDPSGSQTGIQYSLWSDSYKALRKDLQAYAALQMPEYTRQRTAPKNTIKRDLEIREKANEQALDTTLKER